MLHWSPEVWAAIIAAAAAVMTALATIGLAVLTYLVIRANKDLVKAAQDEAQASAATVREMQREQELAVRPFLTFTWATQRPDGPAPAAIDVVVKNIRRGPAIACRYMAWFFSVNEIERVMSAAGHETDIGWSTYCTFDVFNLGPGEKWERTLEAQRPYPTYPEDFRIVIDIPLTTEWRQAVVCQDQFESRFRFRPDTAKPDIWKPKELIPGWAPWVQIPVEHEPPLA